MQALSRELQHSLESFLVAQQQPASTRTRSGAAFLHSSSTSSVVVSSTSSSSNDAATNSHQLRRLARRLERSVSQMEQFWFDEQQQHNNPLDHDLLQQVATPLLVEILTMSSSHDIGPACNSAALHLLSLVSLNGSDGGDDESQQHVDALLDRLGYELMATASCYYYSPFLIGLMELLNRHLLQQQQAVEQQQPVVLLPLLTARDALPLVTFVVTKCIDDLVVLSSTTNNNNSNNNEHQSNYNNNTAAGCSVMRSLLVHFLRHVVHLAAIDNNNTSNESSTMRDWWMQQLLMVETQDGASTLLISDAIQTETNHIFRQLETLGRETLESVLDLLLVLGDNDASALPTSTTILASTAAALDLIQVLEGGFQLHHSCFDATKQSLFVSLTETVGVQQQQDNKNNNNMAAAEAFELLLSLAKQVVLLNESAQPPVVAVRQAVIKVLYLSLSYAGTSSTSSSNTTMDLDALLLAVTSTAAHDSLPLSLLLTTLLLPTTTGVWEESVARRVVGGGTTSPWDYIVARKIAGTLTNSDTPVVLQAYAAKYASPIVTDRS